MAHVPLVTRADLSPEGQARWDAEIIRSGSDPTHMKRALLNHLTSYDALMNWYPLYAEVERIVGKRGAVVYSFAISTQNECLLCTTYFRRSLRDRGEDINGLDFNAEEDDLAAFGRSVAKDHRSDDALVQRLIERYGNEGIVALVGFGILMIGNNIVNSFLKVELDPGLRDLADELAAQAHAELAALDREAAGDAAAAAREAAAAAPAPDAADTSAPAAALAAASAAPTPSPATVAAAAAKGH